MKIFQSRSFSKKVKKLHAHEKLLLDDQIRAIIENPDIGVEKKGDLKGIYIHKFKMKTVRYLLAYRVMNENLELIMLGTHENYYTDNHDHKKSSITRIKNYYHQQILPRIQQPPYILLKPVIRISSSS